MIFRSEIRVPNYVREATPPDSLPALMTPGSIAVSIVDNLK